jgi:AbrB family looped-hinge helix DNA binding protein
MQATIDKAGRVVIPAALRDRIGLRAGKVEMSIDGAAVRIEPVADGKLVERDGLLTISGSGAAPTTAEIRELRLGDQR